MKFAKCCVAKFLTKRIRFTMISWNLLLSGKTLSAQAYAVLTNIVDQACSSLNVADATNNEDVAVVEND